MWSNLYWYYNIRSNNRYSEFLAPNIIVDILKNTQVLIPVGPQSFVNREGFPWIEISCVNSNNGNFSYNKSDSTKTCNLISIVGSKQNPDYEKMYVDLLTKIANLLNWELILEEDDNGDKDILLNNRF